MIHRLLNLLPVLFMLLGLLVGKGIEMWRGR